MSASSLSPTIFFIIKQFLTLKNDAINDQMRYAFDRTLVDLGNVAPAPLNVLAAHPLNQ
jgi:hypothetical protein